MRASNYADVVAQLQAAGLIIPSEGLRIGTHKPVRVRIEGTREKRGWYWVREWSPDVERCYLVGGFGVWRGNDRGAQQIELPSDDRTRTTPEQRAAMKRVWAEAAKAAERQREEEIELAARRAQRMWTRLAPDGDSPYLAAKGVRADAGIKFTPNGVAVVPLVDAAGKIHGLQFLRTAKQAKEGRRPVKEFWPAGLGKKGRFHLIGHDPHWIALVCEGYATGLSLHAATGLPVVVAFDAGNLHPVAEALRKRWKRVRILVCADDDCWTDGNPGVTHASTTALAIGGEWMKPIFADEDARQAAHAANGAKPSDFNDLHATDGLAAVGAQVRARLLELSWAPPALRGVPSSSTAGGGAALRPLQMLDEMLPRFATIYGGKEGVFDSVEHALVTETDVRNLCARSEMFRAWKEHAERKIVRIEDVGFDPSGDDPRITCNLWGGWPETPKAGCCELLLDLLQHMCSGERNSRELYEWVLRWVAYPIQNPGAKMKTTIVVHGPQGTGKNLFFESVMEIYGKYGRILDQDALIDKHNDWASRKLFLIADEIVAQAHRFEVKNKLKTLITGNSIRINPKHVAAYDEANHVNIVFLSNEQMPVVLEEDDRRHCIIWTPEKKTHEYYQTLLAEIRGGGVAALHDYLLHLDLGDFHPGMPPPATQAKRELADLAQDSPLDFVDALVWGDLYPMKASPGLTTEWYGVYQRWCPRVGVKPASLKRFVNTIDRRRQFPTVRKGYLEGQRIAGPASVLLFCMQAPPGMTESTWLGEEISRMRVRRDDWMNATSPAGSRQELA